MRRIALFPAIVLVLGCTVRRLPPDNSQPRTHVDGPRENVPPAVLTRLAERMDRLEESLRGSLREYEEQIVTQLRAELWDAAAATKRQIESLNARLANEITGDNAAAIQELRGRLEEEIRRYKGIVDLALWDPFQRQLLALAGTDERELERLRGQIDDIQRQGRLTDEALRALRVELDRVRGLPRSAFPDTVNRDLAIFERLVKAYEDLRRE